MAQWLSWLERRPVTAKVVGSSPIWVVKGLFNPCGVLAQLGEHLPYKQRVIGSSPIGPIFMFWNYLYLWHIDEKRKNSYDGVIQVPGRWGK